MCARATNAVLAIGLSAVMLVGGGCAKNRRGNRPKTYPVTGIVTLGGEPIAEAGVMFNPSDGGNYGSIAVTDATGRYKLTTFEAGDGAVPGRYQIAVTKTVFVPIKQDGASDASGTVVSDPKNVLPSKYADSASSGFTATVVEGPDNTFDFALER